MSNSVHIAQVWELISVLLNLALLFVLIKG